MKNNDRLRLISSKLNIGNDEMVKIFLLGDRPLAIEEIDNMRIQLDEKTVETCDYASLESFLNGYIIYKRGPSDSDTSEKRPLLMDSRNVNNIMLKKLKIALSLSNEDIVDILQEAGIYTTKNDLTPYFRKDGHKHYKRCSDETITALLDGIDILKLG